MAGKILAQPESSAESSGTQPPSRPSEPVAEDIEPVASSSNVASRPNNPPPPPVPREPSQPLRFVESSASSSGASADEIAPVDDPSTPFPFRKTRHGKLAFNDRYDASEYHIEQLSEYDDIDLVKPWHRILILIHPVVIVWVFLTYAAYYGYRVWCNYQFRLTYGGLDEASWIFICVEGVIMGMYSLDGFFSSRS
jgi:hypothetical protein